MGTVSVATAGALSGDHLEVARRHTTAGDRLDIVVFGADVSLVKSVTRALYNEYGSFTCLKFIVRGDTQYGLLFVSSWPAGGGYW